MPCVGRVERPEQHRAREGGWASNESHEQPKPKTNATAKPTESRSNRTANGSRPESKKHIDRHWNITPPNTHTHTYNAGEGGRAGQASTEISRRPVQSAAEGARPRHSREQRGGVRHGRRGRAVAACWEQCWQKGRCWPDALRAHSRARGCVRCTLTSCVA